MNALYSQKNAAQSRARSVTTFRIGLPTTAWPCSCAEGGRPPARHLAVVLDDGDERCGGGEDPGRAQLRNRLLLVEGQQLCRRPALGEAAPRFVVGRVGDDHLCPGCPFGERVETVADVREAVHRGDDDGQPARSPAAEVRMTERFPAAHAMS